MKNRYTTEKGVEGEFQENFNQMVLMNKLGISKKRNR